MRIRLYLRYFRNFRRCRLVDGRIRRRRKFGGNRLGGSLSIVILERECAERGGLSSGDSGRLGGYGGGVRLGGVPRARLNIRLVLDIALNVHLPAGQMRREAGVLPLPADG